MRSPDIVPIDIHLTYDCGLTCPCFLVSFKAEPRHLYLFIYWRLPSIFIVCIGTLVHDPH